MKLTVSVCIDASKQKVWQSIADITNIHRWTESIVCAYCEGEQKSGVGTVRVCLLKGNTVIKEKFIYWDEGNSFVMKQKMFY